MSGFKRNSSRFGGNGGGSNNDRGNGGGERQERSNDRGSDRGSNRGSGNGGGKKYAFTRLGSLTVPKSADDDLKNMILDELKDSEVRLNLTIYPPKGIESINLKRGDIICISFKTGDKDPEFVVGNASVPNND